MVADMRARRLGGASLRAIAAAAEVSTNTVARARKVPEAGSAAPARHPNPLPGTDPSCYEVKPPCQTPPLTTHEISDHVWSPGVESNYGPYAGRVIIPAETRFLTIRSAGRWSISPPDRQREGAVLAGPADASSQETSATLWAESTLVSHRGQTPATYAVRKWTPCRSRLPRARS